VAYALSDEMKIIDLEGHWQPVRSHPSDSWASCSDFLASVTNQYYTEYL